MCAWCYALFCRDNNDWTSSDVEDWYLKFWFHWNNCFLSCLLLLLNFVIVQVVTNIGSRLCCDISEVIFTNLSLLKINSSYAFSCRCFYVLYKIGAIIHYCEINFSNILVKASIYAIILLFWCTIEKWYPKSSWSQRQIMGILPSYLSNSIIAMKSHNHQKWCPQIRYLLWPMHHLTHAVYPTNELYFLSKSVHHQYPNAKGLNLAPFLLKSKRYSPVSHKSLTASCNSLSYVVCIRIQPMPSAIQPVLMKVGLPRSDLANTGKDVTPFFN